MPTGYWHLQTLWFSLIAVLWIGYFILEGFDFGVGTLLPFLGRDNSERHTIIDTIGPVWDGNEVWLLVAGGATFAAFPGWYATLFSGFYLALFVILFALIIRGVAFEYRGKHDSPRWRAWWDRAIFLGSALPALLWGVAFANIVQGVPIDRSGEYTGDFFTLLNPYALFAGITSLALFTLHGAVFLSIRTKGDLVERSRDAARKLSLATAVLVFAFLAWTYVNAVSAHDKGIVPGVVPLSAVGLVVAVPFIVRAGRDGLAFTATTLTIGLMTATIFLNLYPRVMVSSTSKAFDLTVWNSSSSHYTLAVMTVVALTLTPVVLVYQGWTYYVFRHRVGGDDLGPIKSPIDLLSGNGETSAGAPSGD